MAGAQADCAPAPTAFAAPPASVADAVMLDIDHTFLHWITGSGQHPAAPGAERLLQDELRRLAESPGAGAHLVPRVPAVIPQLLRSLRDDSTSATELSRILSQDVVLVAEVIRGANSPYYRPNAPIKTIESALMLLGQNGMRLLLAKVAFRPVISSQGGRLARLAAPQVWRHAETCAMAANLLAPCLRANPFECYLAGLMQNVGLIVAFRLFDQLYPDAALPQSPPFYAALAEHGRTLSARIATMWEFPDSVAGAIAQAGHPGASVLARTLALADRVAKLRMLVDAGLLDADDPGVLAGLDDAALTCFARLAAQRD
jgi:HD-like signal output (HDOD) protein